MGNESSGLRRLRALAVVPGLVVVGWALPTLASSSMDDLTILMGVRNFMPQSNPDGWQPFSARRRPIDFVLPWSQVSTPVAFQAPREELPFHRQRWVDRNDPWLGGPIAQITPALTQPVIDSETPWSTGPASASPDFVPAAP